MIGGKDGVYVQQITIPSSEDGGKVNLDWDRLAGTTEWKALSLARAEPTWVLPHLYNTLSAHSVFASHLILLKSPDWKTTLVIYPISTLEIIHHLRVVDGVIYSEYQRTQFYGDSSLSTGKGGEEVVCVVCVEAANRLDERRAIKKAVEKARELVGGQPKVPTAHEEQTIWDGLGVCTWESFWQPDGSRARPTIELLLSLIPSFPIKTFLIDDGWQDIISHSPATGPGCTKCLSSFYPYPALTNKDSDKKGDMAKVVSALKAKGIKKVGVWMTLQGYWFGIDPASELVEKYKCQPHTAGKINRTTGEFDERPTGEKIWLPSPERAEAFWKDWFGLLKGWGIDFVKVDNQGFWDRPIHPSSLRTQQALWAGMLKAVVATWGSTDAVIMCMAHTETMTNGPGALDFARPPGQLVFRNSDDFALHYARTHTYHIYNNLHTTILTSHLSLTPDFDMFASSPASQLPTYHALLRSLTPGPLLLSDTPSVTSDKALLSRLTARRKDGSIGAVKADQPAQALSGRWFWDNLKEESDGPAVFGGSKFDSGGGVLGIWNVHDPSSAQGLARDKVTFEDVEDLLDLEPKSEGEYLLFPLGLDETSRQPTIVAAGTDGGLDLELQKNTCEGVIVSQVHPFTTKEEGEKRVAVLGLLDKFSPLAGIKDVKVEDSRIAFESSFASDKLSIFVIANSSPDFQVKVDGQPAKVEIEEKQLSSESSHSKGWVVSTTITPDGGTKGETRSEVSNWRVEYILS